MWLHFLEAVDESECFIKALLRFNMFAQNGWSAEVECLSLEIAFFISLNGVNEKFEAEERERETKMSKNLNDVSY